jgi:uncharacterized protein (TIGR03435 family)
MRQQTAALVALAFAVPVLAAAQQFIAAPSTPVNPDTRFEVVAIKPVSDAGSPMLIRMLPGGLESSLPVGVLLRQALQKADYLMVGAPAWVNTERYAVQTKSPAGVSPAAMSVMILNMLKDRFQLAAHVETREQPISHLVMTRSDGRLGPALKPTSAECQAIMAERVEAARQGGPPSLPDPNTTCGSGRTAPGLVALSGRTIAQLVPTLSDLTGRPVIDKTGLTGLYDFTLKFAFEGRMPGVMGPLGVPPGAQPPAADPDAPALSVALQEQLGLKLESARAPVDIVVIDRFEKPTFD